MIRFEHVSKSYGKTPILRDLSFEIPQGAFAVLIGPSGCGKTTTLNMIGGFLPPDGGSILLDGQDITRLPPERRPVTTVFQSYGLFPHMTVLQNVVYGLKFRSFTKSQAHEKGLQYLDMVGLSDYADARIHEISGGQQQRVALARALIVEPKLCLLDEPFCNLDAALRVKMREELKKLQRELGITMVFVTHDQEEALILADSMAIMERGRLIQNDTPMNIYRHPACKFVSDFLGLDELVWGEDGVLMKVIKR